MQLNYFTYRDETYVCPHCKWQGTGKQLGRGEVSETHWIFDMDCPKCFETIGFVQGPTEEEMRAWKSAHPDWKNPDV